jgi:hypothetical protein
MLARDKNTEVLKHGSSVYQGSRPANRHGEDISGPRARSSQPVPRLSAQRRLELHAHLLHKNKPSSFGIADQRNKR